MQVVEFDFLKQKWLDVHISLHITFSYCIKGLDMSKVCNFSKDSLSRP